MKKAIFLLIAVGVLFSEFILPANILLEREKTVVYQADDADDAVPLDPMEEYPEEGETEDSNENKDNDSKKFQQHGIFSKFMVAVTKTTWNIHDTERACKPYVSQIQQPPEVSFFA